MKRGFEPREAVLGSAEKRLPETALGMGFGVIRIVGDRGLGLGDRLRPLPVPETTHLPECAAELSGSATTARSAQSPARARSLFGSPL